MKFKLFGHSKKTGGHKFPFNPRRCSYSPGYENNCAINALRCIDIISDESYGELSIHATKRKRTSDTIGITLCEFIHILRKTYTDSNFKLRVVTFEQPKHIKMIPDFLIKYSELISLQNGECVVMSIDKVNVVNHMVVFAKLDDELYIIDKQLPSDACRESLFLLGDYFKSYIRDRKKLQGLTLSFVEDDHKIFDIPMNKKLYDIIKSEYFDSCEPDREVLDKYENAPGDRTPPYVPDDIEEEVDNERIRKTRKGGKSTKKHKPTKKTLHGNEKPNLKLSKVKRLKIVPF